MQIHTVRPGDTPASVAARFGISSALLLSLNGLNAQSVLVVGQALLIRMPRETHTVCAGETVYSIARLYGLSLRQLYHDNFFLGGCSTLSVGDVLVIAYSDEPERMVDVSAYADFIARLRDILNPLGYPVIVILAYHTLLYGIQGEKRNIHPAAGTTAQGAEYFSLQPQIRFL